MERSVDGFSRGYRGTFGRKKVGIVDLKLQDIRHDTATKMRRSGIGIDVISKVLGHSNISVTMRYAHVEPELLRAAEIAGNFR